MQREPYRNDFISSLYTILHNSSNSSIVYSALGILGRLEGKSRSTLKGAISLPCVEPSSGFRVVVDAREPIVLDGVIELAVQLLYRNRITESLGDTETKLATSLRTQVSNIQMLRGVRTHYKQLAIHFIDQCLILMFQTPTVLRDLQAAARLADQLSLPDSSLPAEDTERVWCLLFLGLLYSCGDVEVREAALSSTHRILASLACLLVQQIRPRSDGMQQIRSRSDGTEQIRSRSDATPDCTSDDAPFVLETPPLSPTLLFQALLGLLESSDEKALSVAQTVCEELWTDLLSLDASPDVLVTRILPVWENLLASLLRTLHSGTWRRQVRSATWIHV